jgi:hypothetical protein
MRLRTTALVGVLIAAALSACGNSCSKKLTEIKQALNNGLSPGDSRGKVEATLAAVDIIYNFDEFQNLYQGIEKSPCGPFQRITVYVYLDAAAQVSRWEVFISHTGL